MALDPPAPPDQGFASGEDSSSADVEARPEQAPPRAPVLPRSPEPIPSPAPRREGEVEVSWEAPQPEPREGFVQRNERWLVMVLLVLGLSLRVFPILWGSAYHASDQASFHPDEPKLVRPLDDFPESLSTYHDYRYPSLLPFAFGALWVPFGEAFGLRSPGPSLPGSDSYEAAQLFGRALNLLVFGLGGMLLIWAFSRHAFGAGPALLALAAANVMGRPVTSAAMVLPDIPAAVLLFLTFYLLARAESRPRLSPRSMLGVGVALGAAVATKYTAGVGVLGVLVVVGYAWSRRRIDARQALRLTATAGIAALLTFLFFVPGVLYDTQSFLESLQFEYRSKMQLASTDLGVFPRAFQKSFPLWLLAVTAVGLLWARRTRGEVSSRKTVALPAAGLALLVYAVVSARSFRADYALQFFPFVAMFAGVGLWRIATLPTRGVGAIAVAAALVLGTYQSAQWVALRYSGDTHYLFEAWVKENLPPGPLGVAPSPTGRGSGADAPEGYHYVGVRGFPDYIVVFERRKTMALEALADPEDAHQRMVTFWGAERAEKEFSWEPGKRRVGFLQEQDLRFYEDVFLGMRRQWKYDLLVEFEPIESPLDMPGRWMAIYERSDLNEQDTANNAAAGE